MYIKEAHAADSDWPIPIKDEEAVNAPRTFDERKSIAAKCLRKLDIKLPCLVDDLDDTTGDRYAAWPDRIFVVDEQGRIAVRAERGPRGFKPGVEETAEWLAARFPEKARRGS